MHFTGPKSSPCILLLLKHKKCLARIIIQCRFTDLLHVSSQGNNVIKLILCVETKKTGYDSKIVRTKERNIFHACPRFHWWSQY